MIDGRQDLHQRVRRGLLAAVFAATLTPAASAATTPERPASDLALRYAGFFGGFRVADIDFAINRGASDYSTRAAVTADGVLSVFGGLEADVRSQGLLRGSGPEPRSFRRVWSNDEESGTVVVDTDPATGIAHGVEDGEPDTVVPEPQRHDVLDPLAAIVAIREAVQDRRTGTVTLPVYDGTRRLDVEADIGEPRTTELHRHRVQIIPVTATIHPRAGFEHGQGTSWGATTLKILFSDDLRSVPVQITADTPAGVAVLTLECGDHLGCPD